MALTLAQIQSLLSEAVAEGLDADEVEALRWVLLDNAAQMDGATRLDMALQLVEEAELQAADTFLVEFADQRQQAIARGAADVQSMSDDEWQRLTNGV